MTPDDLIRLLEAVKTTSDGLVVYEVDRLGMMAYGTTEAEAKEALRAEFEALWEVIALADDSELTQDALELKRKLLGEREYPRPCAGGWERPITS